MISFNVQPYCAYWGVRKLQKSVSFQPAQLLQVRQALAQQQATQVAGQQAETQKRIEAEATTRAAGLVKIEKEKQKQKSAQDTNATKPDEDDTDSMAQPRGDRQADGHKVQGNAR